MAPCHCMLPVDTPMEYYDLLLFRTGMPRGANTWRLLPGVGYARTPQSGACVELIPGCSPA